jgi:ankyrin repeat protein
LDVSIRLRRAITLNDALLVKRIVTQHPAHIRNPDVDDRSNTSLHLAAKLGCIEIAVRAPFQTVESGEGADTR